MKHILRGLHACALASLVNPVLAQDSSERPNIDQVEEILVTGSRLKHIGEGAARITTFDSGRIDQLGVSTIADVLDHLPQQSFSMAEIAAFGGARSVELHGLGAGTTLVLINGRRTTTSALQGASGYFDLNTVPLSAVDRIDVLSTSASSIYGADAVGGVINIVLKRDIERPVAEIYYGAADDGAEERRGSFAFGLSPGRLRASFMLDYFDRASLFGSERRLTADQDFRRFGGQDFRSATTNPANACSTDATNLPGLPTPCAAIPAGSDGIGLTPADFVATAGLTNLDSLQRFLSIVPESERYSAGSFAEFDVNSRMTAFAEVLHANRKDIRYSSPPALSNAIVPATNPFNPFGVPVRVHYLFTGIGSRRDVSGADFRRTVLGLRGGLGSWDWEIAGLHTRESGHNKAFNRTNAAAVSSALASMEPENALNVFQDGRGGDRALLASLLAPAGLSNYSTEALQQSTFMRGPILTLPGGRMEGVVGFELRNEEIHYDALGILLSAGRKSRSVFLETRIPLINDSMRVSVIEELALTASGRYDRYDDFGDTFNPQFGLVLKPTNSILLRASWGTSFRAPTLFNAYQPEIRFQSFTNDPARNNEFVPFTLISGGNPSVKPEESDFFSAGFLLSPRIFPNTSMDVTYWKVDQRRRIVSPGDTILAHESTFPERINRAPQSAEDLAAGRPGILLSVDETVLNGGALNASGVDVNAAGGLDTKAGRIGIDLAATWIAKHSSANFPSVPQTGRVGIANASGTVPRWKGSGTLSLSRGGLALSATARLISSYKDADFFGVSSGETIDPPLTVDIQGTLTVDQLQFSDSSWLRGTTINAGAHNIFNGESPYSAVGFNFGADLSQADLRQRFFYIKLSKEF